MTEWKPPSRNLRICGVQAALFGRDARQNRQELLELCYTIEPGSCDLIITPEASNLYYHYDLISQLKGGEEEEYLEPFRKLAGEHGCHVLVGSLMVRDGEHLRNRSHLLAPDGSTAGTYDKIHLIQLFDEHRYFKPGRELLTAEVKGWKVGIALCYDLRFAELFLNYALAGCHLQILPSCWPDARVEHWYHLHLARAQETQCYFVGVNHGGSDGAGKTYRMSMAADPDCTVLAKLPEAEPGLLRVTLEPGALVRQKEMYDLLAGRGPFPI